MSYAFDLDRQTVVLCGAGHVSTALCAVLQPLGWQVVVIDDRAELLTKERFPGAAHLIGDSFLHLDRYGFPDGSYYVTMTHAHELDFACLASILRRDYGYVGMLGSKAKSEKAFSKLQEQGFTKEDFSAIHTPIGLPIGAETPAEIAICIAAEMVQVYRSSKHDHVDPAIKSALQQSKTKVLATIVHTSGVVSRQSGTQMVVFSDGSFAGTVGGGSVEFEAIQKCADLCRSPISEPEELTFTNHAGGKMTIRFEMK